MYLPRGFRFAGVSCSIKTRKDAKDVAMIVMDHPGTAAGVYTTNQVVAAPVVLSRGRTPSQHMRGLVVNSGNANACTGERGEKDAAAMTALAAKCLHCQADEFLVMSTGVIGRFLPMEKVEAGIQAAAEHLASTEQAFLDAVDGISTTDAFRKYNSVACSLSQGTFHIAGMAKGAGMIGPKMATMLGVIMTDVALSGDQAQRILKRAVDKSFNCITVEGHMSTNDSVVLFASGTGLGNAPLSTADEAVFAEALTSMCIQLAKQIPEDGEGATHLIEIQVTGARDERDADLIARSVALSNLVKTAIKGGDPNWGRIVSAAGYAGVPIEPTKMRLHLNGHHLFEAGEPVAFDAKIVSQAIKAQKNTLIQLQVGTGHGEAKHWTTDLNEAYVQFNSEYTT
jgi:glutamate N-acetyltransferase / amino-acid N-acetyltransferase